ncbi:hypothetical protein TNIN_460481 [Trichonephila inaurata madagascariensis]|uniref:Uncharacterized protein n=1 Tax=Trichonephila inaurata madagascariensis TaxID=2747483 RepID=A0A8X6M9C4_9ARAC|nr:hypothetical protein TNIN_460481 [Trichonephila inaurata madagascariensis]
MNVKYFLLACLQLHVVVLVQSIDLYSVLDDIQNLETKNFNFSQIGNAVSDLVQKPKNAIPNAEVIKNFLPKILEITPQKIKPTLFQAYVKYLILKKNGAEPKDYVETFGNILKDVWNNS